MSTLHSDWWNELAGPCSCCFHAKKQIKRIHQAIPKQYYSTPGPFQGVIPRSATVATFQVFGAGASGGSPAGEVGPSHFIARGGGGGAGASIEFSIPVQAGTPFQGTIGTGGLAPSPTLTGVDGNAGSSTTLQFLGQAYECQGGQGGDGQTGLQGYHNGGTGGFALIPSPSFRGIAQPGQSGQDAQPGSSQIGFAQGGEGGASVLGSHGGWPAHVTALSTVAAGTAGLFPGAGGGGGGTTLDRVGTNIFGPPGSGANGCVIVTFL